MKYAFLLSLLFCSTTYCQEFTIKEFKCTAEHHAEGKVTISFPQVITKNPSINKLINQRIKLELVNPDHSSMSLAKSLSDYIKEWLTDLTYEIKYSKNGLLCLKVDMEGDGAYPWGFTVYLNFDLRTGKYLTLPNILVKEKLNSFKKMVFADKKRFLSTSNREMKDSLAKHHKDGDTSRFHEAIDIISSVCIVDIDIDHFCLWEKNLEVIDPCGFPRYMQDMTPLYELKYSYARLKDFIKPAFRDRLPK
jgi:hypothetical protein